MGDSARARTRSWRGALPTVSDSVARVVDEAWPAPVCSSVVPSDMVIAATVGRHDARAKRSLASLEAGKVRALNSEAAAAARRAELDAAASTLRSDSTHLAELQYTFGLPKCIMQKKKVQGARPVQVRLAGDRLLFRVSKLRVFRALARTVYKEHGVGECLALPKILGQDNGASSSRQPHQSRTHTHCSL